MKNTLPRFRVLVGLLVILFSLFLIIEDAKGVNSHESKQILYINSYHCGYVWSDSISRGIINTFQGKNIDVFTEYLDAKRFGQSNFQLIADHIIQKYKGITFSAVIVSDNDALDFAIRFGDKLFPSIPVIFCGISNPSDYKLEGSRFYGFIERDDAQKTLALITTIFKEAKSVLIVIDNTTTGKIYRQKYIDQQINFPNLKLNFVDKVDEKAIIELVKSGKAGDVVANLGVTNDDQGKPIDNNSLQQQMANVSPNPIFSSWEHSLGTGVIGGYINIGFEQGRKAALLAIDYLNNKTLKAVPHINKVDDIAYFDYNVLKKFKVSTEVLPPNALVLNKPLVKYLRYIKILLAISMGLLVVIVVLVFNIKKRIIAELKVQDQMLEIQDQNAQLEESYQLLGEMNTELEETNDKLATTNNSLVEAMKKAEESDRLKSSFLANMSHEIRTPLNAIVGFSSLLVETDGDAEKRSNYISIINSNSESLLVLIDDILDLSKIEAGQFPLHFEKTNVLDIFLELQQFLDLRNYNKIDILIAPDSLNNPIMLTTDKVRLKQILSNLLTNSLKFTEKGFIEMGYHTNKHEVTFWVKDTGIGIEEQYLTSIFDRFIKIQSNHDKFYPGTGLGLAITKRLVEMLGGKIWLESEPGKGSVFYFTLPLRHL